jgi:hypothetical protein
MTIRLDSEEAMKELLRNERLAGNTRIAELMKEILTLSTSVSNDVDVIVKLVSRLGYEDDVITVLEVLKESGDE